MKRDLRVLTFTSLFPNAAAPSLGGFIARRMEAWAQRHAARWAVVAPVPWFPRLPFWTPWSRYAAVPRQEIRGDWRVFHPRYPMLPKVGLRLQGRSMGAFAQRAVKQLNAAVGPFDLVDGHFVYPDGYAARIAARLLRVPLVVSARGTDIDWYPDLTGIAAKISTVLAEAAAVVAVSGSLRDRMVALGARPECCHVIPNGVNLSAFAPASEAPTGRRVPRLLAVGNLVPEKGFVDLIEAVGLLTHEVPGIELVIVGAGPERNRLEAAAGPLGGRIRMVGQVSHAELPSWYRQASVFCLSSRREGCPNVVMEALASGVPVAATAVGGVPDIIREGENGALAADATSQSIADALRRVLRREWDPLQVRATVAGLSWERTADRMQAVFDSVAGRRQT